MPFRALRRALLGMTTSPSVRVRAGRGGRERGSLAWRRLRRTGRRRVRSSPRREGTPRRPLSPRPRPRASVAARRRRLAAPRLYRLPPLRTGTALAFAETSPRRRPSGRRRRPGAPVAHDARRGQSVAGKQKRGQRKTKARSLGERGVGKAETRGRAPLRRSEKRPWLHPSLLVHPHRLNPREPLISRRFPRLVGLLRRALVLSPIPPPLPGRPGSDLSAALLSR